MRKRFSFPKSKEPCPLNLELKAQKEGGREGQIFNRKDTYYLKTAPERFLAIIGDLLVPLVKI